jgi:SAM-dependent methyltransferase
MQMGMISMALADRIRDPRIQSPRASSASIEPVRQAPICPLCGYCETSHAFSDNGCSLRTCSICGLFFVHPYPDRISQHARVSAGASAQIEILDCERRYMGERLYYERHLGKIIEECQGAKSLLDVGCGTGYLLGALSSLPDFYTAGIELNAQAAQFARRVSGRPIYEVPLEEFRNDRKFDVITLINVLSHVPSFDGMFHSVRSVLRPGGKVILRTSEMRRNASRWNQVHWGIPDDIHFLGLETLDFLCAKYGFAVTRHDRAPFEDELFLRSRWEQLGRSKLHNLVKAAGIHTPLALPILKKLYAAILGQRLFVSFIVLTPLDSRGSQANRGEHKSNTSVLKERH